MVLQKIKNAFIYSGVRFWSVCDLTHNNIRSAPLLALTFAFIMAGALSFLVLLLTPPDVPGLQINVIALPGQRQTLGAPLREFSVQLQRGNGQAMADVQLQVDLTPSLPFFVETRVMDQTVPNFQVDCRKDIFWKTRQYLCNMTSVPGAQTLTHVKTDQNGLALVRGLKLNYGPPGDYELRIRTVNADPVLPDIDKSITVSFFAAVERLDLVATDLDYTTGQIKASVDVYANVDPQILSSSIASVLPMRYPRVTGIIPGWLPVASILEDDEPVIDPTQQFFTVQNARRFNANLTIGRIEVVTRLIGATGTRFGASVFIGGASVPVTALVSKFFYPSVVSSPEVVVIPNVYSVSFSTTMPPPATIAEATNASFQVQVKDASGNGIPGIVVCFRAVRRFQNPNAGITRATNPKFLPFNHSDPTDANGVATFKSDYLFSLSGEVGSYFLYANVGYFQDSHPIAVLSRVGSLNAVSRASLDKNPPVSIQADTIVPSKMNFFVYDEPNLQETGTIFPVPGKQAVLEIENRRDIRVETSPRVLTSDSQGYFYVDGLRVFVPPRGTPSPAYNFSAKMIARVDGRIVHSVPFQIFVAAIRNATKSKKVRARKPKDLCIPFNLTINPPRCSSAYLPDNFCPYNYSVDFNAFSYNNVVNDLIPYGPLSDSGLLLEKRYLTLNNQSYHVGTYTLTVKSSLSTVRPYGIFNVFLMSSRCKPSKNALNPWISGREMSFALYPDERDMSTLGIVDNATEQEVTVVHKVVGAPLNPESDTVQFIYYPSWFPRENFDRSRISSLGLNITCDQVINETDYFDSHVVCPLPRQAFVYPGSYYFVPYLDGVFYQESPAYFTARQDIFYGVHGTYDMADYIYSTDKITFRNPRAYIEDPPSSGNWVEDYKDDPIWAVCWFGPNIPVVETVFRPINKSTGKVLPIGTAIYFKLRRHQASDGQVFTYDMWSNASHIQWGGLAKLIQREDDIAAQNAPTEEQTTDDENDGFGGDEGEEEYYGEDDSFSDEDTGSSSYIDPNDFGLSNNDEYGGSSSSFASSSSSAFSSSSSSFASSSSSFGSSSSSFGSSSSSSSVGSSSSFSDSGSGGEEDEGSGVYYVSPPVAFVEDDEEGGAVVYVYLVDLAGFRTESTSDVIEIVLFTADDVEIETATIWVGDPNTENYAGVEPCQYNIELTAPTPANIQTIPPSVIGPNVNWGFVWKTEAEPWLYGLISYVKCEDSITRVEVACVVDSGVAKNTWYARSFISKTGLLAVKGISFPNSVPTGRSYSINAYFPGFDGPFRAGQIYLGLDGCLGQVVTELPSPIQPATSYYTAAKFTCAKLPLRRTIVVAEISSGDSAAAAGSATACTGSNCGVLSSPRDFATTDNTGTARFQLLIASAPAGPITISYAPATPDLYTKAAQLDAILSVGVGKPINGIVPGAALLNAYEVESTSTVAQLFSSLSNLIAQVNRPAVGKPALLQPLGLQFSYIKNLLPRPSILFEKVETPMLFLDQAIIIQLNATGSNAAEFGLKQRVSIEVWNAAGTKQITTNWVTFNNKVRQWFMTDEAGVGVLPSDSFVWGTGGTFTLRFNCRGELSAPTKPFTIVNPNAASIADLQEQAQSMMSLFLLVASPMLLANVPEMPHFVTFIAVFMCVAAMIATPAVVDIGQMFKETPLLGFHILVTYMIVWFLALGFIILLIQGMLRAKNPNSRCIDREDRSIRAFRYYRWLANARKSKTKTPQVEFQEMLDEQTNAMGKKVVKPVRMIIDKLTSWNEALNYNLVAQLGEWEEVKVLEWEPAVIDPPDYLMPPTAPRYVLVISISVTLMAFMGYAGYTMLLFVELFLKVFDAYLSAVVGNSADVFNDTVLSTLKNSVGLVIERFPEFGFLRSLIPLIETIDLGSILKTISVIVESFANHSLLLGFISLAVAFAATSYSLSRTPTIKEETLKQRRKVNSDGDLGNAENYVGIHCVIFAFQALAAFIITFVFLVILVIFFRYLPQIWNWFWTSEETASLGALAIITTILKTYMDYMAHTKIYITSPLVYGLWIIPSALHSVFAGIGVLIYRVFAHFFVGFAFAFAVVTRPLTDPLEDPVYVGFTSMAAIDAMYQNPAFISALGFFLATVEQKNLYVSTKERAEAVKRIIAHNQARGILPENSKPASAPQIPPPKRLANPSDFGSLAFYPHIGHMIRLWISYDMGLLDRLPWMSEARRDPADDEASEDPMVDHASRQGGMTKISKFFFDPAENIAMDPTEVAEELKAQDEEARKNNANNKNNNAVIERVFDPSMFPYDRPRWPSFAPEDIRRRRFQRKWYLLLLLHFNPDLQKYRKHRLVQLSGYHYAPDGSHIKKALEKVYGPEPEEGKEVVDIENEKSKNNSMKKKEQPKMIIDQNQHHQDEQKQPLLLAGGGTGNADLDEELMNFVRGGNNNDTNNAAVTPGVVVSNNNNNNNSTSVNNLYASQNNLSSQNIQQHHYNPEAVVSPLQPTTSFDGGSGMSPRANSNESNQMGARRGSGSGNLMYAPPSKPVNFDDEDDLL